MVLYVELNAAFPKGFCGVPEMTSPLLKFCVPGTICPFGKTIGAFERSNREGRKIGDMRKFWHNATKKAGLEGKVIHDFRRSTARNLTSLGVPQQVIMARCGWKTTSTFHRYAIVDSGMGQEA